MPKELVNIKGTKNGLLILCDPTSEFESIKQTLTDKLASAKGFFEGAKFLLPQQSTNINENQKTELEHICQAFGLVPHEEQPGIYNLPVQQIINQARISKHNPASQINPPGEPTLLIQKNLRNGQKISYPGHIVFLGNVNRGAEITAEGNIVVLGCCYGFVHAGYPDNREAKVIATLLAPSQIRIADLTYKVPADRLPTIPEIAFIRDTNIIIREYLSKHLQAQ